MLGTRSLIPLAFVLTACRGDDTGAPGDSSPEDTAVIHGEVHVGVPCPRLELAGALELTRIGDAVDLSGSIHSAPWPIVGPPVLENEHCAYHHYDGSACGDCEGNLYCSGSGSCVPLPTSVTDITVVASAGGTSHNAHSDPQYGWLWEQWAASDEEWTLEVAFGQDAFSVPAMSIATEIEGLSLSVESSSETAPGALDASWTPRQDGALVRTEIPLNHHAGIGTFTLCEAGAEVGSFHADAEMIDPLSTITGLEFQGVSTLQVASVQTSVGCVELRYGTFSYVQPSVGR